MRRCVIEPTRSSRDYLKELFLSREVCYFLAWRDIKVRYKQALFGAAWAVVRPLFTMFFFTLIFSKVAHFSSNGVSYPLFVLLGMMIWQLVSAICHDSASVLISHAPIVTKVYFPRMLIPLSVIVVNLFDFVICYALFLASAWITQTPLSPLIVLTPLLLLQSIFLAMGLSLWSSALTVRYRDFRFIVMLLVQFGLFVSPVGYASSVIPAPWDWVYPWNPVVGIIEGLRFATFGVVSGGLEYALGISFFMTLLILTSGYYYFRRIENVIADII